MTDMDEMPPAAEFDISLERPAIAYLIHKRAQGCLAHLYFQRVLRTRSGPYHFRFASDAPEIYAMLRCLQDAQPGSLFMPGIGPQYAYE